MEKRKLHFYRVLCALTLLLPCYSCQQTPKAPSSDSYFEWIDSYGRYVTLDKEPERLISLSPGITEMLFMLEAGEKLVGITDFCEYPPETDKITRIGGIQNFSMEHLLSLQPDAVLIGSIVPKEDVEKIEKLGIPIIAIKEESKIDGIYHALIVLGKIVGKQQLAEEKTEELKEKIKRIDTLVQDLTAHPLIYYVVGFGEAGDYTAPGNSHINEIITLAGGKNLGEDLTNWNISREYLFQEEPDLIFIREEELEKFKKSYPYTRLKAIQENRVYPIESGWIDIVSPRNILAVEWINKKVKEWEP